MFFQTVVRRAASFLCLFPVVLVFTSTTETRAQSTDDPYTLITWNDVATCNVTGTTSGCCGSYGNRECPYVINFGKGSPDNPSSGCVKPDDNLLRTDRYEVDAVLNCNLEDPVDAALAMAIVPARTNQNPSFTFDFTSDLHFFRDTFDSKTITSFPQQINVFSELKTPWPDGIGTPPGDTIAPPVAVIMGGDMTTGGGITELGAFRLVWEEGRNPSSILYPIMPGLGNHDVFAGGGGGAGAASSALRMYSYLNSLPGVSLDKSFHGMPGEDDSSILPEISAGSHNYSWDWQGVHFVQLNLWAGFSNNYNPTISDGLTWLTNDLSQNVGRSNRPVVLIQHFDLLSIGNLNGNAVYDSIRAGNTHSYDGGTWWQPEDYYRFWDVIKDYNVIALFDGHSHYMQVNRPEHYQSPGAAGYPKLDPPTDSAGNAKIFDEFTNGSGGMCQTHASDESCEDARASFYTARVSADYLDVAAVVWHSGCEIAPQLGEPSNCFGNNYVPAAIPLRTPGFWGGTSACRKRINSQYFVVSNLAQYVTFPVPENGDCSAGPPPNLPYGSLDNKITSQDTCVAVRNNSNFTLNGPIALRVSNGKEGSGGGLGSTDNLITRSFVDSCDEWFGNAYVLLSDSDILPGGVVSARVAFLNDVETVTPDVVELLPLGDAQIAVSPSKVVTHGSHPSSLTVNVQTGPTITSITTKIAGVAGASAGWLSISGNTFSNHSGSFTLNFDSSQLTVPANRNAIVTITGNDGSTTTLSVQSLQSPPLVVTPASVNLQGTTALVHLSASDGSHQNFTAIPGNGYKVAPTSGTTPLDIKFIVDEGTTPPGIYNDPLTIKWGTENETLVPVSFSLERTAISTSSSEPFTVDGTGYSTATVFSWVSGTIHEVSVPSVVSGSQGTEQVFQKWSDGLPLIHPITAPAYRNRQSLTADFSPYYQLTVNTDPAGQPGQVSVSPQPAVPGNFYPANSSVVITATPLTGSYFSNFSGDLSGSTSPVSVLMSKPKNVIAKFLSGAGTGQTEIETNPANHFVLVDSVAYKTPHVFNWGPKETHLIQAMTDSYLPTARFVFTAWTDGVVSPGRTVTGITSGFQKFSANLQQQFLVIASAVPANSATISGTGWYAANARVTLTATPAPGFTFSSFAKDLNSVTNPVVFQVPHPVDAEAVMAATASPRITARVHQVVTPDQQSPNIQNVAIQFSNLGSGPAGDLTIEAIDGFSTIMGHGAVSTFGASLFPISLGTFFPATSQSVVISFYWPESVREARAVVHVSANGGKYTRSLPILLRRF